MICKDCRAAGNLTAGTSLLGYVTARTARQELHARCRGGSWCECQHVLPPELPPTVE